MPRLLLLSFLFWLTVGSALAQTKKIDSLRAVLAKHPQADTFRVNRLNDLVTTLAGDQWPPTPTVASQLESMTLESIRLAKHIKYPYGEAVGQQILAGLEFYRGKKKKYQQLLQQALVLAQKSGDKKLISQLLVQIGMDQPRNPQQKYFQRALAVARSSPDPDLLFDTHIGIVNVYAGFDYPTALKWALPLLASTQKDTNKINQYKIAANVAELYTNLKDYDQALTYYQLSQQVARKRHDRMQEGASFCRMGILYLKKNQPDQAIQALIQGLPLEEGRREDWVVQIQIRLADAYQRKGMYRQTFAYAYQALATMKTSTFEYKYYYSGFRPLAWIVLSQAHLHTNRLDSALYYANLCLPTLKGDLEGNYLELPRDVTKVLAEVYAQKGDYSKAHKYQSQYITYKDSLNNEEVTRKATSLRFTDQMSRQQSQIALLQKDRQLQAEASRRQRQLLYASLAVLALIGGFLVLLYRNNRQKQKANALLERQKAEIQIQRDQTQQALTELKVTQQQLIQKEKMASLGELTAGIAHEIQNPLNFVNNFSEVSTELIDELKEEAQTGHIEDVLSIADDLRANLQKINHHGQRASSIVKGMLEHSRTSTGEVQPTNLNALADEFLRLAYHGLRAKDKTFNAELVTDFDPGLSEVEVVPQEMGRVLLNLYNNAFYAVQQKQKIAPVDYQPLVSVSTRCRESDIEIRVNDNGTGIPEDVQQKIFQPFFTTKPTGEGTGLGLSLSYDIITKGHNGSLRVESQEGVGTEFIIELPMAKLPSHENLRTIR